MSDASARSGLGAFYRDMAPPERRTFWACFMGWLLDGMDFMIYPLVIGTVIVMNTMLLSFVERIREFGILRAVGWSRRRLRMLILGEALLISLGGAALGVALSFVLTRVLEQVPEVHGILHAQFSAGNFWRALYTAGAIGLLAALYPAIRAGRLQPLAAMRRE